MQKYEEKTKETCQNGKNQSKRKNVYQNGKKFLIHFDFLIRYLYDVFI